MIEGRGLFLSVSDCFRLSFIFVARFIRFVDPSSTCRITFRVLFNRLLLIFFQATSMISDQPNFLTSTESKKFKLFLLLISLPILSSASRLSVSFVRGYFSH